MPTYQIECKGCAKLDIIYRKVAERDNLPLCTACKSEVFRKISLPMISPDIEPYKSPNGNYLVNSRSQRQKDLQRSGAIGWEPGLDKDIARNLEHEKEKAFEPIAKAVDQIVTEMNVAGKLENLNA